MANLENNNDKENKKSIAENIGDSVQKGVENVQDTVKETVKGATNLASDAINHPVETAKEFGEQAAKDVTSYKWWAKLLLVIFWTALFLVLSFIVIVSLPATKNWAAQKVISKLNEDLNSKMSFESVDVNYFGDIHIHKVAVKDHQNFPFLKAKELYADSDWFSIISNSRNLQFQSLSLDELDLKVITYKGDSISNFIRFVDLFNGPAPTVKREPFQLKSRVSITNSKVSIINQNTEGEAGKWLNATNLNLVVPNLKVVGPEVSAQINNMRFITERWGKKHFVDTFSTNFSLRHDFLFLKDLTFNTDHSLLQGDVKFNLNDGSWSDFTDKVKWDMQLQQGSQISGYDISYFVTDWDNYKPINISGKMMGPLNKFTLNDFLIRDPQVNIKTKSMKISNILKGNFQIETNTLSTDFTYKDLKAMMPTFISSKMKNFADDFGRIKFDGAARVTPKQVYVPNAKLVTGIGQAKINQFYLEDFSTDVPKYRGFAEVNDLNTSVITKSKEVGLISGKFNVEGRSFDVNTMVIRTRSQIAKIEITDKVINNVYLEGILDHKKYNGIINVNDEEAKANIKGLIDFSTSKLYADVNANVDYLNINYFTGAKRTQAVSGFVDGKISMTNINDLTLDAELQNINFATPSQKFYIPNANVKAFFDNGNRIVSVDAPGAVTGRIAGKFNLGDLAGMIENGFGKILVGPPPRKLYRGQNFDMNFEVKQSLVNYFMPDLHLPKGATIDGSYDGNSNNLILNVDAETLKYVMTKKEEITEADKALAKANPDYKVNERDRISKDSAIVDQLMVRINTANLEEQILVKIDRIEYNQNILKDITLSGNNENNQILHIATNFKLGSPEEEIKQELKEYTINLNQSTNSEGDFVFRFEPTTVKFNEVAWSVDTDPNLGHAITYRKKTGDFLIENLRLYSDKSELFLKDAIFKSAKDFSAEGEVRNLDIAKVFALIKNKNEMDVKGIANGNFNIKMDKNNLEPLIDLDITDIFMNGNEMGTIEISTKNSPIPNVFDVDVKVLSTGILGDNNLHLTGTINNNTASPSLDLVAKMNEFDVAFAQQFVEGIFSNIRGKASGDLRIAGQLNDIDYSGDIALKKFGLKLDFTGVDYSFDDTVVSLSRGLAILNDIGVKDGRSNSLGSISGAIQFETLSSMGVNLVMRAENLLLLNTTQKDNDLFWGRVYGNGTVYVDGPVSGLSISTPEMRALNNSVFTFNSNSATNVEEFKMLRFLKRDETGAVTTEKKKRTGANMNVDFNLAVDKGTTVNVLVGDDIGDITVRGNSERLRFTMSRTGAISMNGNYIVDNGTFVSKAILNRTFQIAKASSIRWDGDPIAPQLDINATYLRTVTNAGQYLNMTSLPPINVLLSTKITQTLNNPKIDLGVSAQDVSSNLKETLAEKMSNEDEKIIQFGSVLVLNSFNVSNSGGFDINIGNFAESSGYNMLFKQLGSVLNTISNEFQVDLNYLKGDAGSNTGDRANASLSFALSPRITVKTGLGIPISKSENAGSDYLSGEGIVEYDWSKNNDGTRLLRAYSKPTNIGLNGTSAGNAGANQSYGAGVVYSKSFNTIFKRKKKNKNKESKTVEIKTDSVKNTTIK
ncbi:MULTISPECIES: translocation/assembly module TamB [unclassified Kaistella]|uniref:translocation/assembly module TamB domain-containing protein n=1 Tax=unclassified Kaistella TaxID=2762626 RepID=UPI0027324967|nr:MULTISPECIES: translocation/assembly module TamB [unclassified Kaistella]MDP2453600.1 translocation/assembly module TamB [Kaistella sp. SH11-4b]MDP2456657.1 translocation/assembly module TamB [Kaistella sp. SH40-3]MDP2459413.1 translocation/assembly module TamB [Kaistella sp. SH19-2b]